MNFISPELFESLSSSFASIILLIILSLSARYLLIISGQQWVKTFSHTATLTILPIITFVITKVISGNIALSLGMVGALSIVRFRNPVKSPFELAVYFGSITMGIAASVSLPWLIFFALSILIALLSLLSLNFLSKLLFKSPMFETSFSEGNQLSTLEVNSSIKNDALLNSYFLISVSDSDSSHVYILASHNKDDLKKIYRDISEDPQVISCQLNA